MGGRYWHQRSRGFPLQSPSPLAGRGCPFTTSPIVGSSSENAGLEIRGGGGGGGAYDNPGFRPLWMRNGPPHRRAPERSVPSAPLFPKEFSNRGGFVFFFLGPPGVFLLKKEGAPGAPKKFAAGQVGPMTETVASQPTPGPGGEKNKIPAIDSRGPLPPPPVPIALPAPVAPVMPGAGPA